MLFNVINVNRCLNNINGLMAQDKHNYKRFNRVQIHTPTTGGGHQGGGVTKVVSGGNFTQNRKKS